jgi:hypothetical protein
MENLAEKNTGLEKLERIEEGLVTLWGCFGKKALPLDKCPPFRYGAGRMESV